MRTLTYALSSIVFCCLMAGCNSAEDKGGNQQAALEDRDTLPPASMPENKGTPVIIYMVEPAVNPDAKHAFGCGDSLVGKEVYVQSGQDALAEVMRALLASEHSGPHNYIAGGSLEFDSLSVDGKLVRVYTHGELKVAGICDHDRISEQFRATATQFNGVDSVVVYIGKETLNEYLGLM